MLPRFLRSSTACLSTYSSRSSFNLTFNALPCSPITVQNRFYSNAHSPPSSHPPQIARIAMPDVMTLTFLGTAAGRPCGTRNVSSLALKVDKQLWVVDAGEGTQHQFMKSKLKMSAVSQIFITHMHADHVNGLVGLLCTISAGEGSVLPGQTDPRIQASQAPSARPTELYGPSGLREFVRLNLRLTQSILTRPYVVHELLFEGEEEDTGKLHPSEREGRNIRQENGVWKDFTNEAGVDISAGPILHTVNCIGYIFNELPRPLPLQPNLLIPHLKNPVNASALLAQGIKNPLSLLSQLTRTRQPITLADGTVLSPPPMGGEGRKVVVLGDTYDASGCIELAQGADLVVHEATNAYLPTLDESQAEGKKRDGALITRDSVRATAKEHGHSTPEVAGEFARAVGSKALVMNHLSVKYPDFGFDEREDDGEGTRNVRRMIKEIERLASEAWGGGEAKVARDFMEVEIPRRREVIAEQEEQ